MTRRRRRSVRIQVADTGGGISYSAGFARPSRSLLVAIIFSLLKAVLILVRSGATLSA